MFEKRLGELIIKYLEGVINPAEQEELSLLARASDDGSLEEILENIWKNYKGDNDLGEIESGFILNRILETSARIGNAGIMKDTEGQVVNIAKVHKWRIRKLIPYAAVFALAVSLALLFNKNAHKEEGIAGKTEIATNNNFLPGKEGAILKLSDGREINLDSQEDGFAVVDGSANIVARDGILNYSEVDNQTEDVAITFNKLFTPKGREFKLLLPDGTRVWLNAESSITYPTRFSGDTREVTVTGEVYFEVSEDKSKPFYAVVSWLDLKEAMRVEVLGTHFNIQAYDNNPSIKTTLFEGKVELKSVKGTATLNPGLQGVYNDNGFKVTDDVDLDEVLAWKNGYFQFNNADIRTVMNQLERWYDFKVDYVGEVPGDRFGGKIPRDVNITEVLEILRKSKVNFSIEGNKVIVTK